jgi:hypothetical protein
MPIGKSHSDQNLQENVRAVNKLLNEYPSKNTIELRDGFHLMIRIPVQEIDFQARGVSVI